MFFDCGRYRLLQVVVRIWESFTKNIHFQTDKDSKTHKRDMIDGIYEFIAEKTDNDFFEFNDLLDFLGNRGLIDKNDEQTKRTIRGFLDELRRQKFLSSEEDCDFFHIIV